READAVVWRHASPRSAQLDGERPRNHGRYTALAVSKCDAHAADVRHPRNTVHRFARAIISAIVMTRWGRTAARLAWVFWSCAAPVAQAQVLPSEPIAFGDGHVAVSGDVAASFGCEPAADGCHEDRGFFNYEDYAHSALRVVRVGVSASIKAGPHFSFLSEVRTENFDSVQPYAFYLRIRPWVARDFDIQVGRVPPTFGAFSRRTYANDNPLIGYPLAYQYATTMRFDALPAGADELLAKRGGGWLVRYTVGNPVAQQGVPLVSAFRWDTGVQAHGTI